MNGLVIFLATILIILIIASITLVVVAISLTRHISRAKQSTQLIQRNVNETMTVVSAATSALGAIKSIASGGDKKKRRTRKK